MQRHDFFDANALKMSFWAKENYGQIFEWCMKVPFMALARASCAQGPPIRITSERSVFMTHPVDVHVGKRIRHRRWLLGMTQHQLAEKVGIKFQQIQKYETGANRVSASRLYDISDGLGVPISFFFEGLAGVAASKPAIVAPVSDNEEASTSLGDMMGERETMELVRTYYAIPETQRRRLFDLARVLSDVA